MTPRISFTTYKSAHLCALFYLPESVQKNEQEYLNLCTMYSLLVRVVIVHFIPSSRFHRLLCHECTRLLNILL